SIEFANKKYNERSPKIAKILDVYRIKGSSGAMAKIAGILSTAKTKSVISITAKATKSGVAYFTPCLTIKNLSPLNSLVTLKNLCTNLTPKFLFKSFSSPSSSDEDQDFIPAIIKKIPNTNNTTFNSLDRPVSGSIPKNGTVTYVCLMSSTPAKIKIALKTKAPKIPQNNTLC